MNEYNPPQNLITEIKNLSAGAVATKEYVDRLYKVRQHLVPMATKQIISEVEFYRLAVMLKPQAYSSLFQNYFIIKIKAEKVGAQKGKGDFKWKGNYYEYKISAFNIDECLHIVQVRLWQECGYVVQYMDKKNIPPITFILNHQQMMEELNICNASSAHGTVEANKTNINREFRFTVKQDTKNWERWVKCYQQKL